jgi:hypothetical protein
VQNGTLLRRLKALRRAGAAEPGTIRAAPAVPGGDAERVSAAWRPTVWFNPWMYQTGEQVWAGLAHEIIKQTTDRMSAAERENFWLRLNLGRVDEQAVRRKIYGLVVDRLVPWAAGALAVVVVGLALLALHLTRWVSVSLAGGAPAGLVIVAAVQALIVRRSRVTGSLSDLVRPMDATRQATEQVVRGSYDELVSSPDYQAKAGFFSLVRSDVQRVLNLVATPQRPLVVFVDDLDRCSPGTVVQVIEAINLFLAGEYPNSIFVIAMEPEMVAAHIEAAYSDLARRLGDDTGTGLGWRFLEKIVQLPLMLPVIEPGIKTSYIRSLFPDGPSAASPAEPGVTEPGDTGSDDTEPDEDDLDESRVAQHVAELAGTSLSAAVSATVAVGSSPRAAGAVALRMIIDQQLSGASAGLVEAVELAAPYLTSNPREIKRFVNIFRFLVMIDSERGLRGQASLGDLGAIAKLAVLQLRWPALLIALGRRVADDGTVCELIESDPAVGSGDDMVAHLTGLGLPGPAAAQLAQRALLTFLAAEPHFGPAVRPYL